MKKEFKVYDCFMFNDESFILNIRLNILDKYVDKFVIVESLYDFAGNKKKLQFDIKKFKKFKDKIIYIKVSKLPKKVESFYYKKIWYHQNFVRENFQRNQIMRGLKSASPNDLIIISDIDEIPNLSNINFNSINKCVIFYQRVFRLKFNLECKDEYPWQGSRILKYKYLKSPQDVRRIDVKRIKPWQIHRIFMNPKFIRNGGWHFTSILPLKEIVRKYKSGAHGEININKFDVNLMKKKISKGIDIVHDHFKLTKISLDKNFPEYITRNKKKFKNFIA